MKEFYKNFLHPFYSDIEGFVLDTLFPISCLACGKEASFICSACQINLTELKHQRCMGCHKHAPFGITHPHCQKPAMAEGLISFFDYHDERVSEIVIKGKYSFIPNAYALLGKLMAEKIVSSHEHLLRDEYFLVPIPLSPWRKRWRGFNQSDVLCQELSLRLGWEVLPALQRVKHTKTQKDLKRGDRIKNVANAFALSPLTQGHSGQGELPSVKNKNLILVDDITTTGSTLLEAVKILKHHGATKVICLTVARD